MHIIYMGAYYMCVYVHVYILCVCICIVSALHII